MRRAYVLDTSALLAYLFGEQGGGRVVRLLSQAATGRIEVRLHRIHLGEAYYLFVRKGGEEAAESMLAAVRGLPVRIEDRVTPDLMRAAARIKASHRLCYADAFAAGLALVRRATLASCDRGEFGPLDASGEIKVLWVR